MKPIITKPAKPVKTTKPLKSQNSWNRETSKLWHLRKFRNPRSSKRFQVPCEQHEILNTKKPLKSQNLWNHETSNYNTYYRHLKQNTINAIKPWILALALYCRSFHFRDFFSLERGGRGAIHRPWILSDVIILIDQFWYVNIPTWLQGLGE